MIQNRHLQRLALIGLTLTAGFAQASSFHGAGSSFAATIYKAWNKSYQSDGGDALVYDAIGSGGGIKKIKAGAVDFGASDMPLSPEQLDQAGLTQFPTVVGGVIPVINVPGIITGTLKLDGPVLAGIFMGKITHWNDPAITSLNPGLNLPNAEIHVIHRSDSSGTTFIFTNYLSKVSPAWKSAMGEGTTVPWKVGTGCRSNLLMPICMYRVNNSIAYMDYAFAALNNMNMPLLKNQTGQYVGPSDAAFQASAKFAKWEKPDFYEILTDEPGGTSWPIVGATFILMHKTQDNPATGRSVLKFFDWSYSQGNNLAEQLGYVPLPTQLQQRIRQEWAAKIKDSKGNPLKLN